MNTTTPIPNFKLFICIVAVAACAALSGPVLAQGRVVTLAAPVSSAGLDLSRPAGARELYSRLRAAARLVCGSGNRVGLEPVTDFAGCYEKALADAIQAVNQRQLTMVYLGTHTLQEASARGVHISPLVASK
jgi:UrcA family protein